MGVPWGSSRAGRQRMLVCLDLQRGSIPHGRAPDRRQVNCRRMLAYARDAGWRVAHVHNRKADPNAARPIPGLEPLLTEPVLYRSGLSAFSNRTFAELVASCPAELVVIGYPATSSFLATALIAYEQEVSVVLVEDAVCPAVLDPETRDAVELLGRKVASPFVTLICTDDLIGAPRLRRVV